MLWTGGLRSVSVLNSPLDSLDAGDLAVAMPENVR